MVSRQRAVGNSGAATVVVIAGHDQLIATAFDNLALAGHVVIQRALAQLKRCVFCDGHVAAAERGGIIRRQRTAVNVGIAVVVRRVAEDERAIAFFEQRFTVPVGVSRGFVQFAGDGKGIACVNGKGAVRNARRFCARVPAQARRQHVVGIIIRINARVDRQVIRHSGGVGIQRYAVKIGSNRGLRIN